MINWVSRSAPHGSIYEKFLDFTIKNGFEQLVTGPTRLNNLLDVVLTNEPLIVNEVNVEAPISNCDHCQVNFSVVIEVPSRAHTTCFSISTFHLSVCVLVHISSAYSCHHPSVVFVGIELIMANCLRIF